MINYIYALKLTLQQLVASRFRVHLIIAKICFN
jgi:hypothetical protein